MTLAVVYSRALAGMAAPEVTVEAHLANGLPAFTLVGLPEAEVRESRERVRAAILQSGFEFPARRITVNLAPAELPKESGRFDLPIAVAILVASGQVRGDRLADCEFVGELALTGALRRVRGVLPMVLQARAQRRCFILPQESAAEAALLAEGEPRVATNLAEVCAYLNGLTELVRAPPVERACSVTYPDLADVKGQLAARLALEVAAAGGHSLLMQGPPGTGKSMLAMRLPGLLPVLAEDEALESAAVQSLSVAGFDAERWGLRPFRAPHHSASIAALVGGGSDPRPGEISLAHHGVLFLDELPEFDRRVLESLREPLESGQVQISRAARQVSYPAGFQLVAAMNPCPCGYLGHPQRACRCTPEQVSRYRAKLSGPLLDRIDLLVDVPALPAAALHGAPAGEDSASVRERVRLAREVQLSRQGKCNARLLPAEVERWCTPDEEARALLQAAMVKLGLSARSYHRVLKVARTLADRERRAAVGRNDVMSALQFRRGLGDALS